MKTIRRQLTRELLGVILLLLGAGLIALYFAARDAATEEFDDVLDAKALAVSTLTSRTGATVHTAFNDHFFEWRREPDERRPARGRRVFRGFEDNYSRDFFEVWDAHGRMLARSQSLASGQDLPRRVGTLDKPARWNFTLSNGRPGRAVGFTFQPKPTDGSARDGDAVPYVQLVVASDRGGLDETLWQLLGISAVSGVLLVLATLWVIPRVLRRGLQPLEFLGQQATAIDASSLATRFPSGELPAELQPIVGRWNELLARLEASFERERRFSADLAHELRTPVAELRSLAECALKWPDARDPAMDADTLAIAKQMETLVAHILALARGEQGQLAVRRESVELSPLVQSVWRGFENRAAARELRVSFALAPVHALADPALLRSILTNLCENAVEYTPAGGEVHLAIAATPTEIVIGVENTTHDVQPDDVPKFFDRFWRKEAARSGGHHFGLGLSLARNFASAMGSTLTANFSEAKRLVLQLAMPAPAFIPTNTSVAPDNVSIS
jgi:two-component system sensor histidine kinase QseC